MDLWIDLPHSESIWALSHDTELDWIRSPCGQPQRPLSARKVKQTTPLHYPHHPSLSFSPIPPSSLSSSVYQFSRKFMSLTATLESPKHWDLGRVVRRKASSSNESDNHFSFKKLVGKARRGRNLPTSGADGDAPPPPPPKDDPKRSFSPSTHSARQSPHKGIIDFPTRAHLDFAVRSSLSSRKTLDIYRRSKRFVHHASSLDTQRPKPIISF